MDRRVEVAFAFILCFKNRYVIHALMIVREINYGKFITDEASEDAGFFEWAEREK